MIEIIAIEKATGERTHVEEYLYFFEEQCIRSINDESEYDFEIFVDDVMVYPRATDAP